MKSHNLVWISVILAGCSQNSEEPSGPPAGASEPLREVSGIICPVHEVPVFKIDASHRSSCGSWDPILGVTIEQLKERFPYAVWDSKIYQIDDSPNAVIPRYNLVCDRCTTSWREYAIKNAPPPRNQRLEIHIASNGEVKIHGTQFTVEQLPAIVKTISAFQSEGPIYLKAESETPVQFVKSVIEACKEGGIKNIVFGAFDH